MQRALPDVEEESVKEGLWLSLRESALRTASLAATCTDWSSRSSSSSSNNTAVSLHALSLHGWMDGWMDGSLIVGADMPGLICPLSRRAQA